MSVRRLADDAVQPEAFKFNRAMTAEAKGWIKKYPKGREQSAVIPLLMLAQEQEGWVTKASIEHIAEMLGMPLIRVMEVATFYTQFMLQPVGTKAHIQVCGTTPCMLRGSEELMAVCKKKIAPNQFELNAEGTLSWEEVECQGACVNAPMVMIFKDTYEDLTPERLEEIIDAFEAGKGDSVKPGPQIDRIYSAPEGGLTTLTQVKGKNGKALNPTMKLASTASAAKSARAKASAKAKSNAVADRLASLDDGPAVSDKFPDKKTAKGKAGAFGTDPGSVLENVKGARSVKPKAAPKKAVTGGNPTMKLAATASGTAAKAETVKKPITKTTKNAPKKAAKPKATTKMSTGMIKKPNAKKAAGPERLKKPQGKADDLKLISGVGPKLEKTLNDLGFWHFSQIAKWKKSDVAIVDNELSFKGRIERDDWIKQAKALAKNGGKK